MLCSIILQNGDGKLVQTDPTQASQPHTSINADDTTSSELLIHANIQMSPGTP